MTTDNTKQPPSRPRSTRLDFVPPMVFASVEEELAYYKGECQRLKGVIALQKQKIKRLVAAKKA